MAWFYGLKCQHFVMDSLPANMQNPDVYSDQFVQLDDEYLLQPIDCSVGIGTHKAGTGGIDPEDHLEQEVSNNALPDSSVTDVNPPTKRTRRVHIPHCLRSREYVARRNARERQRVDEVNTLLYALQQTVPTLRSLDPPRKVTKARILEGAIHYIRKLHDYIGIENPVSEEGVSTDSQLNDDGRELTFMDDLDNYWEQKSCSGPHEQ